MRLGEENSDITYTKCYILDKNWEKRKEKTNAKSDFLICSNMDESSSPNPSSSSLVAIQLPSGAVERSPQGNYVKFNEI